MGVRVLAGLLVVVAGAVVVLTMTDWGRERVRLFSVGELAKLVNGDVDIARVRGNLLTGATLEYVSITDTAGRPFLSADTVSLRYSIRSLFDRHLVFSDVRLVRPVAIFDQPPGESWNVSRIFQDDTVATPADTVPGWGDWVRIEDLEVVDGTVWVRRAWEPDDDVDAPDPAAREGRERIVEVPGGYQALSSFHRLDARFPLLRLADPDSAARVVEVDTLSMVALPFRPPAARVRDLEGRVTITEDTLGLHDLRLALPDSRLRVDGFWGFGEASALALRVRGGDVALEELRWLRPSLPEGRAGGDVAIERGDGRTEVAARGLDVRVEGGTIEGSLRVALGEGGSRVDESDLRFASLDTRTIERLVPEVEIPVDGTLEGRVRLAGTADALDLDGRATLRERNGAVSRVVAEGGLLNRPGGLVARGLDVRLDPLNLAAARAFFPELPLRGSLAGRATLDGPLEGMFEVDADLVHRGPAVGTSHLVARGGLRLVDGLAAADLRVRGDPVQTDAVRIFAPDFPLEGTLAGPATLDGPLTERFALDADLVHADPALGRSRVVAAGELAVEGPVVAHGLRLRLDPLQAGVVREFAPDFPLEGTFEGEGTLDGTLAGRFALDADLVHRDPDSGTSRVAGVGEIDVEGPVVAHGLRLRLEPLQAATVRAFDADFPLEGTLAGRATLDGPLEATFSVDADLAHASDATGRSRVEAVGRLRLAGGFAATGLRFRADPLTLALARRFRPELPLDGVLTGSGTLHRATAARLDATVDVTHEGSTGVSSVEGAVALALGDGVERFDVDVVAAPLSLATVGRFAPEAGLRGGVSGSIDVEGTPSSATLDVDLDVVGGGAVAASGTVGVGPSARYDVSAALAAFDASAVTSRAPATSLSGEIAVEGVGTEPATARAVVDARLADSRVEGTPRLDSTRILARVDEGLVTFEEGRVRLASAAADVEGSFGLVEGRSGELRYAVVVDTLARFRGLVPPDSGVVRDRPLPRARALARARADSVAAATDLLVESLATGRPMDEPPALDTVPPTPRDSVAGSLRAEGVLEGNLSRFDVRGSAVLDDFVLRGAEVGSGEIDYQVDDVLQPGMKAAVEADLADVRVDGFAFDAATVVVDHAGGRREGEGRAEIVAVQDDARDYHVVADYDLALERQTIVFDRMAMRFDTTLWTSTRPGTVSWSGAGVEVDQIELVSDRGGRVFADGRLPDGVPGDLRVEADSVRLGHIAALLQDTLDTRGLLSLDASVTGTLASPVLEGELAVEDFVRGGEALPAVRAAFDYADQVLSARAEAFDGTRQLLEADLRLPLDLALAGREGPRLLEGPIQADLRVDSLPLQVVPTFTPAVEDLRGRARGTVALRGTFDEPRLDGSLDVRGASAHLPDPELTLTEGAGTLRFEGRRVVVDSLVASSGGRPVRAEGEVDLADLTDPVLALDLSADDAVLLDDERGRVRGRADIHVEGPLEAPRITGDVHVTGGEISIPEPERYHRATRLDDPSLVGVLDTLDVPVELRPGQGLLSRADLDVRVHVERDTWLRNTDLDIEVYTPPDAEALRVTTDPGTRQLTLEGVVNTDRGRYAFAGRELELTTGSVTFLGEADIDPLLQLNAQHEVPRRGRETLVVVISVGGYLSAPVLSLSSNHEPPLPESDLLSYLAFGREASDVLSAEGSGVMGDALGGLGVIAEQQLAGLGLGALTDALFSAIEREGLEAGFDVFRARPAMVPDELSYGGFDNLFRGVEVEAGEYLGDRFFLAAEMQATGQALPGLHLEYRRPDGFSWTTSWERRFLSGPPTLGLQSLRRTRALASFLTWRWRY